MCFSSGNKYPGLIVSRNLAKCFGHRSAKWPTNDCCHGSNSPSCTSTHLFRSLAALSSTSWKSTSFFSVQCNHSNYSIDKFKVKSFHLESLDHRVPGPLIKSHSLQSQSYIGSHALSLWKVEYPISKSLFWYIKYFVILSGFWENC